MGMRGSERDKETSLERTGMRERKTILFHCDEVRHNVRVTCLQVTDRANRRPIQQTVMGCTFKTEMLCKVEFYPSSGESQCRAVKLAQVNQFK